MANVPWVRPATPREILVASIDPGVSNLALVVGGIDTANMELVRIVACQKYNLKRLNLPEEHWFTPYEACTLPHTNETCDQVAHLMQKLKPLLDMVELVLMEQQPTQGGAFAVQQLIMHHYRPKVVVMYSMTIQNLLEFPRARSNSTSEEQAVAAQSRKSKAMELARPWLQHFPQWQLNQLTPDESAVRAVRDRTPYADRKRKRGEGSEEKRQHDMADAVCSILAWCITQRRRGAVVPADLPTVPSEERIEPDLADASPQPAKRTRCDSALSSSASSGAECEPVAVRILDRPSSRRVQQRLVSFPEPVQVAVRQHLSDITRCLGVLDYETDRTTEFSMCTAIERHKALIMDKYAKIFTLLGLPPRARRARYALSSVLNLVGLDLRQVGTRRRMRTPCDSPDFVSKVQSSNPQRSDRVYCIAPLNPSSAEAGADEAGAEDGDAVKAESAEPVVADKAHDGLPKSQTSGAHEVGSGPCFDITVPEIASDPAVGGAGAAAHSILFAKPVESRVFHRDPLCESQ